MIARRNLPAAKAPTDEWLVHRKLMEAIHPTVNSTADEEEAVSRTSAKLSVALECANLQVQRVVASAPAGLKAASRLSVYVLLTPLGCKTQCSSIHEADGPTKRSTEGELASVVFAAETFTFALPASAARRDEPLLLRVAVMLKQEHGQDRLLGHGFARLETSTLLKHKRVADGNLHQISLHEETESDDIVEATDAPRSLSSCGREDWRGSISLRPHMVRQPTVL